MGNVLAQWKQQHLALTCDKGGSSHWVNQIKPLAALPCTTLS